MAKFSRVEVINETLRIGGFPFFTTPTLKLPKKWCRPARAPVCA